MECEENCSFDVISNVSMSCVAEISTEVTMLTSKTRLLYTVAQRCQAKYKSHNTKCKSKTKKLSKLRLCCPETFLSTDVVLGNAGMKHYMCVLSL